MSCTVAMNQVVFATQEKDSRVLKMGRPFESIELAIVLKHAGKMSVDEIAAMTGRSYSSVHRMAKHMGVSLVRLGEQHQSAKYPAAIVREAVRLKYDDGLSYAVVSRQLNVPVSTVKQWCLGYNRVRESMRA